MKYTSFFLTGSILSLFMLIFILHSCKKEDYGVADDAVVQVPDARINSSEDGAWTITTRSGCPPGYQTFYKTGSYPAPPCCPNLAGVVLKIGGCVKYTTFQNPFGGPPIKIPTDVIIHSVEPAEPGTSACFASCLPEDLFRYAEEVSVFWFLDDLGIAIAGQSQGEHVSCISAPGLYPMVINMKTPNCVHGSTLLCGSYFTCNEDAYCESIDSVECDPLNGILMHFRTFVGQTLGDCPLPPVFPDTIPDLCLAINCSE